MHRRFTEEEIERIWDVHQAGVPVKRIARIMGRQNVSTQMLISRSGGIRPKARVVNERQLSLAEREEISMGLAAGLSLRAIAEEPGRAPSTIWAIAICKRRAERQNLFMQRHQRRGHADHAHRTR